MITLFMLVRNLERVSKKCKSKDEREAFCEQLQEIINLIISDEILILLGDLNSGIRNNIIPGV